MSVNTSFPNPSSSGGGVDNTAISPSQLTITTNGSASTPIVKLNGLWFSGGSATTTKPLYLIEPNGTTSTAWSTSGTGLGINAATGFSGNLIDAQLAGVTSAKINYQGQVQVGNNGSYGNTSGTVALLEFYNGLRFGNQTDVGISWSNSPSPNASVDIGLYRDEAGVLAQRKGVTSQEYRIYSTYTSSTNYERFSLKYVGGATECFVIATEKGSVGGSRRPILLMVDETATAQLDETAFMTSGNLKTNNGKIILQNSIITSTSNGNFTFTDSSESNFGIMQFGGTSSASPAIKASGYSLNVRYADDSGDAPIIAAYTLTTPVALASLPSASSVIGARAFINDSMYDATTGGYGNLAVGGGMSMCPVFSDGSWRIG